MLRVLSKRVALWATGHETWTASSSFLICRWRNDKAIVEPPKPPPHVPAEHFEWNFLLEAAESEEEKQEIIAVKNFFHEAELLDRKNFKMTVDWEEFEGKVPDVIIDRYKQIYAEAVKDYEAGKFDPPFDQADWDQKTGEVMKTVHAIVDDAKIRLAEVEAEIQKTEGRLERLDTATIDEELASDPDLAKKVDEAVSKELGYTP